MYPLLRIFNIFGDAINPVLLSRRSYWEAPVGPTRQPRQVTPFRLLKRLHRTLSQQLLGAFDAESVGGYV